MIKRQHFVIVKDETIFTVISLKCVSNLHTIQCQSDESSGQMCEIGRGGERNVGEKCKRKRVRDDNCKPGMQTC